ncbi:MAG: protein kinase [Ignavibacteriales bacterium]|nr:protein kinase [Ignavibacteriales bacterium]
MIGQTISHYKILEKLGEGGMGVVYKAQDLKLDRLVALKFLPPHLATDEKDKQRFIQEAKAASSLDHPNICNVHEVDETPDGQLFIVMAMYDGESLSKKIGKSPLKIEEALDIAAQVAEGLQAAHEKGITHRDIKSSNIIVTEKDRAIIMDFGLARSVGTSKLTKTGSTLGTVPYMSPEQARGEKVDHRSDIWSLGVVIYEMVTGQLPFRSQYNEAIVYSILNENPQPLTALRSGIPLEMERIVHKCLEKNPSGRYQHADELMVDLRKLKSQIGKAIVPLKPFLLLRSKSFMYAGVVMALALVVLLALPLFRGKEETIQSIAVLPFENLSGDATQEYFVDGMTDALIADLGKISALRVISRTSVMQYKKEKKPLAQIAKELNVDAVVEGSLLRSGNQVQVRARLLSAPSERQLWSQTFNRDVRETIQLQNALTSAIVEEIKPQLRTQEQVTVGRKRSVVPAAYEEYLRGTYSLNTGEFERGMQSLEKSIQLDPNFAGAYADLALSQYLMAFFGFSPPNETFSKVKELALKASGLDETLPEAHGAIALIKLNYEWDWAGAEQEFKRALDLNPSHSDIRHDYAHYLMAMGRNNEALEESRRAVEIDPFTPILTACLGWHYMSAQQYEKAITQLHEGLKLDPEGFWWHIILGWCYEQQKKYREAIAAFQLAVKYSGGSSLAQGALGHAYAVSGRTAEGRSILTRLLEQSKKTYVSAYDIASIYVGLGDNERTFEWLEKAYNERSSYLIHISWDPRFERLHDDPKFRQVLKNMGFESTSTSDANKLSLSGVSDGETGTTWRNSIAVLPFKNISADKEQEYFCDGMTEQLITNLTNLPNVKVIARTSVMQFKNTDKTARQIAQELGVAHLLEGSVRKAGNKIRVTAQLIKAEDGFHLWAKDYDRQLKDIFVVQDDVSNAIVEALKVNLTSGQKSAVTKRYTESVEAYQLYLKASFQTEKLTKDAVLRGIDYFNRSLELDPSFAKAYVGLSYAYMVGLADWHFPPKEVMPKSVQAAQKALQLDSLLADAHALLGLAFTTYNWDWQAAERAFQQAIRLNPRDARTRGFYGFFLAALGRFPESIREMRLAQELDPLSMEISTDLGWVYYYARQYDQSIDVLQKVLVMDANYWLAHVVLGRAYEERGMTNEALKEFQAARALAEIPEVIAALAFGLAKSGRKAEAEQTLAELKVLSRRRHVPPYDFATVYLGLGQNHEALTWLERAYEERSYLLTFLRVEPKLDPVRSGYPEYTALLKKMGLEK